MSEGEAAAGQVPDVIGVVGAGTMGAGIAQLACLSGARTLLYDPVDEALDPGADAVRSALARGAERGRYGPDDASAAADRLEPLGSLESLAPSRLVIEAAPESLPVKHEIFERLSALDE